MPSSISSTPRQIATSVLTEESFRPFGAVVQSTAGLLAGAASANQGTALKIASVCPTTNVYHLAPSKAPAKATTSMFVCSPRKLRRDIDREVVLFDLTILERHPYTSQTFVPLGLDTNDKAATCYLVIVCPSLPLPLPSSVGPRAPGDWTQEFKERGSSPTTAISCPPDLANLKAFIAHGKQAVTYAAGTWHAPMVVLGKDAVEFVVFQFANGVEDEDCQEINVFAEDISGEGVTVLVDSVQLEMSRTEEERLERSKI